MRQEQWRATWKWGTAFQFAGLCSCREGPRSSRKGLWLYVCVQGRGSFKPDIPGPASLWHFPEKVKGEKTLYQPTQPPTHSVFSDSCFLWGLSWARAPDPCPRGPILLPTEEVWGGWVSGGVTLGGWSV